MSCPGWEERIALLEDDQEVASHLAACAGCREFAAGIAASLSVLQEAHAEEIDPAHYAAVRARVLGAVEPVSRPLCRRWWALAAAGAAAAVLIGTLIPKPEPVRAPVPAPPPVVAELPVDDEPAVRQHTKRARRATPRPKAQAEPLVVKIVTDDPNIVIYWVVDSKGD